MVDGHVEIRDGLCLYALRGINDQQGTFAGSYGTGDLVGEVHMSRGINEVQDIFLALVHILHLNGMTLDGDATFALQVHIIEHLTFSHLNGLGKLQHSVSQGRLTVVDMSDDTEVSYMIHVLLRAIICKITKIIVAKRIFLLFFITLHPK